MPRPAGVVASAKEPRGEMTGSSFRDRLDLMIASFPLPSSRRILHACHTSGRAARVPSQKPCRRLVFNLTGALEWLWGG